MVKGHYRSRIPRTPAHVQLFKALGSSLGEYAAVNGVAAGVSLFNQTTGKTAYWKKKVWLKSIILYLLFSFYCWSLCCELLIYLLYISSSILHCTTILMVGGGCSNTLLKIVSE